MELLPDGICNGSNVFRIIGTATVTTAANCTIIKERYAVNRDGRSGEVAGIYALTVFAAAVYGVTAIVGVIAIFYF